MIGGIDSCIFPMLKEIHPLKAPGLNASLRLHVRLRTFPEQAMSGIRELEAVVQLTGLPGMKYFRMTGQAARPSSVQCGTRFLAHEAFEDAGAQITYHEKVHFVPACLVQHE